MVRYQQLIQGTLPNVKGAIEIVPGVSDSEYSLEGVKSRVSEIISNLSTISNTARVITIRDKYGDSVSVFKGKNHVHARYTTDAFGGLGSNPNRIELLSVNFRTYIFEFDHLKVNDVVITANMKLYKKAGRLIFKYGSCDDESALGLYKNPKYLNNYEFQKIVVPM